MCDLFSPAGMAAEDTPRTAGSDPGCDETVPEAERHRRGVAARVGAVADSPKTPAVDVAVQLRRGERAVPEQLLDGAEVGAALEQVRGECVAQPVRMREDAAERRRVEPLAARGDEHRVLRAADELRPGLVQVPGQHERRLLAEWDDALLAALPAHV